MNNEPPHERAITLPPQAGHVNIRTNTDNIDIDQLCRDQIRYRLTMKLGTIAGDIALVIAAYKNRHGFIDFFDFKKSHITNSINSTY